MKKGLVAIIAVVAVGHVVSKRGAVGEVDGIGINIAAGDRAGDGGDALGKLDCFGKAGQSVDIRAAELGPRSLEVRARTFAPDCLRDPQGRALPQDRLLRSRHHDLRHPEARHGGA